MGRNGEKPDFFQPPHLISSPSKVSESRWEPERLESPARLDVHIEHSQISRPLETQLKEISVYCLLEKKNMKNLTQYYIFNDAPI